MSTARSLDGDHLDELADALAALAGTNADEQVLLESGGASRWLLDVACMDLGDGERFAVYVEYGPGPPFERRGLPLPPGSEVEADEGSAATVTFGALTPRQAAEVLHGWAQRLGGDAATWTSTLG